MVPMVMLGAEGGADAASLRFWVSLSVFPLLVQLSALSVS